MAERSQKSPRRFNTGRINQLLGGLGSGMDNVYKNTYYSDRSNSKDLNNIADGIEDKIAAIVRRNKNNDTSKVSQLYARTHLRNTVNSKDTVDAIKNLFDNNPLTDEILASYTGNKWIKDLDNEIDMVLKYCTKMMEALLLMRDAVLSADSFSKDIISAKTPAYSADSDMASFEMRMGKLIKKYDIQNKLNMWYMNTSKYGEQFVYVVPYKVAIAKLLTNKANTASTYGNYLLNENGILDDKATADKKKHAYSVNVEFDLSCTLKSCIESAKISNNIVKQGTYSLNEALNEVSSIHKKTKLDITIPNELEVPKELRDDTSTDGLLHNSSRTVSPSELKVRGAVIKALKRENVIPLYVDDDVCLGYYYLEFTDDQLANDLYANMSTQYSDGSITTATSTATTGLEGMQQVTRNAVEEKKVNDMIRHLSATISKELNNRFINANQDLTKEIYAILLHNDIYNAKRGLLDVRISFLPEEDVLRLAYNIDPDTHRGISDCLDGLIPAKLLSCLYITDTLGKLTRGQDKRVYYVKQTIDTNISQTLLNVINQIKKGNFGIRQIQNLNKILNITGRYNDYVIPVGPSGDAPVQFEVMPGQQFDIDTDLYNMLEEMAVNSTGVNIELVQNRNSPDFATQFTSTSIKVLRTVFHRQGITETFLSKLLTKIYACEYEEEPVEVEAQLPPPMFLTLTNTSQLLQNANDYSTAIATYEYEGDSDPNVDVKRAKFIRKMNRHLLASYVKSSLVDRLKEAVELEVSVSDNNNTTTDSGGGGNSGGDMDM